MTNSMQMGVHKGARRVSLVLVVICFVGIGFALLQLTQIPVAVVVLNGRTLAVEQAWRTTMPACLFGAALDDSSLVNRPYPFAESSSPSSQVERVGRLAVISVAPMDFGGMAIASNCDGTVLYSAAMAWRGGSHQIYPAAEADAGSLFSIAEEALPTMPDQMAVFVGLDRADSAAGEHVWQQASRTDTIRNMVSDSSSVMVYQLFGGSGAGDVGGGSWVVVVTGW